MRRPTLPLDTPSLRIGQLVAEDAARLLELSHEEPLRRWLPNQVYRDEAEARSVVDLLCAAYEEPGDPRRGPYVLAIAHRADRLLIGHVGFSPFGDDVEIGFAIAERYQRRGLATEAIVAASGWALEQFGLPGIVGVTAVDNVGSRQTLARAGFAHDGDRLTRFQGSEQPVSVYRLSPGGGTAVERLG